MEEANREEYSTEDTPSEAEGKPILAETQPTSVDVDPQDVAHGSDETREEERVLAEPEVEEEPLPEILADTVRIDSHKSQPEGEISASPSTVLVPDQDITKDKVQEMPKRRGRWLISSFLGLLALTLIAMLSSFSGYYSGISMRQDAAFTQEAQIAIEQFELGLQDMEQGNYFRARQRFEYVIQLDPSYPGAVDKLADVLLELNTTATPTLVPTPTLSPTPDLRGVQEVYDQAAQYLLNEEWSNAIESLLQLRKVDPEFKKVDVDGMLFLALRNRAEDKILIEADLESGIYDLTLAQRFGILDAQGQALFDWATFYITGASFWGLDWGQAAYYFSQVAPHAPNLRDGSGLTASERYSIALFNYAKQLFNKRQFCEAQAQLNIALTISQDAEIQDAYQQAAQACEASQQPRPGPGGQPTPSP